MERPHGGGRCHPGVTVDPPTRRQPADQTSTCRPRRHRADRQPPKRLHRERSQYPTRARGGSEHLDKLRTAATPTSRGTVVPCVGGVGVMAAVTEGAASCGGLVIGIRPDDDRPAPTLGCPRWWSPTWVRPATRSSCTAPTRSSSSAGPGEPLASCPGQALWWDPPDQSRWVDDPRRRRPPRDGVDHVATPESAVDWALDSPPPPRAPGTPRSVRTDNGRPTHPDRPCSTAC